MNEQEIIKIMNTQIAKNNYITLGLMAVGYGSFFAYKYIKK
jgi:hypothetical protein